MTLFHSLLRRSLRLAPFKLPNRHRYNNKYNNNCSNNNINQHSPFSTDPSRSNNAGQLAFDKSASDPHNIPPAVTMATVLSHAGVKLGEYNAPMSPPLHLASTYTRPPNGIYGNTDSIYSRSDNPTRLQLEDVVRQLETHGDERLTTDGAITTTTTTTCAFASGMAAVSSLVLAHQVPLTVLLPKDLYHGVSTVMIDVFDRFQVTVMRVDMRDEPAMKQALLDVSTPHAIVWMETPSNPMCHVVDIERLCQLVRETSSLSEFTTVVDSTLCPPCLTQPLRVSWTDSFSFSIHKGPHAEKKCLI
jgi:cystathionine gamma-synthase